MGRFVITVTTSPLVMRQFASSVKPWFKVRSDDHFGKKGF